MIFKKIFIADSGSATLKTPVKMSSPKFFFGVGGGVMIFKKIFIADSGSGTLKTQVKMSSPLFFGGGMIFKNIFHIYDQGPEKTCLRCTCIFRTPPGVGILRVGYPYFSWSIYSGYTCIEFLLKSLCKFCTGFYSEVILYIR